MRNDDFDQKHALEQKIIMKTLIFDFDGTIVIGSNEKYIQCFWQTVQKNNKSANKAHVYKNIIDNWGKDPKFILSKILDNQNETELERNFSIYRRCTDAPTFSNGIKLVPGGKKTLISLHEQGHKLAIASASRKQIITDFLNQFELVNLFSSIISSQDDITDPEKQKPNPYILHETIKKLNSNPKNTYYIGDAVTDIMAAKNAGVISVAVLTGHLNITTARQQNPDFIINSINDLPSVL